MTTQLTSIADYEIVDTESKASNGWFYLAVPPARLGLSADRVVLKVIDNAGIAFDRFGRELRAFSAVPSSNLVRLYDAGQQDNRLFYSMEWCPMGSLAANPAPIAVPVALCAVAGAARAAHALHEAGITHRDIQPRNVLITEGSGKLRDLGLARMADPQASMSTMPAEEAIEFVDPALIKGEPPSRATDLYALGATLHRALSGRPLFAELPHDALAAIRHVLRHEPKVDASIDDRIALVIERCIDAETKERYASAAELADALEALQ